MDLAAPSAAYDAARRRAGLISRNDRGRLVVSGGDRRSWLHALLTNDIESLKAGEGSYAAYLTPQGRMISDLYVYELGDAILLVVSRDVAADLLVRLDRFVFAEDVQLGNATDTFWSITVVGPEAARVVGAAVTGVAAEVIAGWPEHANQRVQFAGEPGVLLRTADTGARGFEIMVPAALGAALGDALMSAGAIAVDDDTAEAIRIEGGVPRFHRDMSEDTIPLEAGIEGRAISMSKGCYVGQEVIVRVLHRGHGRIAKKLVGLTVEGEGVPAEGARIDVSGREVGHVTSSARSPALKRPIALGYVHRDFVEPGTRVTIAGAPAIVTALPFVAVS